MIKKTSKKVKKTIKSKRVYPKHGDYFIATIDIMEVTGRISKEEGRVYLCQNYISGSSNNEKFGFDYSWYKDGAVSKFRIVSKKESTEFGAGKLVKLGKIPTIDSSIGEGWSVRLFKDKYIFGCGELVVTQDEANSFYRILDEINSRNLDIKTIQVSEIRKRFKN